MSTHLIVLKEYFYFHFLQKFSGLMDQYSWLTRKKAELSAALGKSVTWDDFARHVDIEPRALKNYRLPESSSNHRTLSKTIRGLIELRVEIQSAASHSSSHEQHNGQFNSHTSGDQEANTVDKTWGYVKDDAGNLRINLHHSSLEYQPK